MNLKPEGKEYYTLTITTTPAVTSWDASFDGGTTWATGAPVAGQTDTYQWLVAGANAPAGGTTPAAVLTRTVQPEVRATSTPETIVRDAPRIFLD